MSLGDFYEIRDFQNFNQQNILNVYHVRNLGAGGPAANVATTLIQWVFPFLLPFQDQLLARTVIEVQNLASPFDFASVDSSGSPGTATGTPLSTFSAATIQFNRTRTDIKNGMKRFTVGAEGNAEGNVWTSGFLVSMQALADQIVQPWELDATPGVERLEFVILKRFCTTSPSPPCAGTYRLPETDAEADNNFYAPNTATARNTIRSQVSRKRLV
jgi:hypothetical protein